MLARCCYLPWGDGNLRLICLSGLMYVVRTAVNIYNHIPCDEHGRSRIELFGGTAVMTNLNHFHTFGCPVFVLDSNLASDKQIG
eukprot:scaffold44721_cov212-Skeletonema_marinoi.AAC.2